MDSKMVKKGVITKNDEEFKTSIEIEFFQSVKQIKSVNGNETRDIDIHHVKAFVNDEEIFQDEFSTEANPSAINERIEEKIQRYLNKIIDKRNSVERLTNEFSKAGFEKADLKS